MGKFTRAPLYLGLFVMTIAVVVSAVKVGNNRTSENVKAGTANSALSLNFSSPDIISLAVSSDQIVAGIDAMIKFDKDKVVIMPSSLKGTGTFVTSGGKVDESQNVFSFSAVSNQGVKAGMVASFQVKSKNDSNVATSLQLDVSGGKTAVLSKTTGENISVSTTDVKFTLPAK